MDEKSMIGLETLSLVDNHLRTIFPASSHLPFGALKILLCGDVSPHEEDKSGEVEAKTN